MRQIAIRATSDRADVYLLNLARRRRRANLGKHTRTRSAFAQAILAEHVKSTHEMSRHHARGPEVPNDSWN